MAADDAQASVTTGRHKVKEGQPGSSPSPRRRLRWLRREGIDLGDAVVQFFAVLLGVLLALLISQWNDHRQQQAQAQATMRQQQAEVREAMKAIHIELTDNRTALHGTVAQLYADAKHMYAAPANRKQAPRPCYLWGGFGAGRGIFVNLTDAAYKTAIATQALAHMTFKQAHQVAEVYGGQQVFETGVGIIRSKILGDHPQKLGQCIGWMEALGLTEASLSDAYTMLIGPDKAKWPAPPLALQGLTKK